MRCYLLLAVAVVVLFVVFAAPTSGTTTPPDLPSCEVTIPLPTVPPTAPADWCRADEPCDRSF